MFEAVKEVNRVFRMFLFRVRVCVCVCVQERGRWLYEGYMVLMMPVGSEIQDNGESREGSLQALLNPDPPFTKFTNTLFTL